jgi:hypothetical protein
MSGYGGQERLYVIPQDEETRISILNADRNTKEDLRRLHRFYIEHDWQSNTIALTTLGTIVKVLYSHLTSGHSDVFRFVPGSDSMNVSLNFYDLLEIRTTAKKNDNAEKEGNINIAFYPGSAVDAIISDDTPREDRKYEFIAAEARYSFPNDAELTKAMLKIEGYARASLGEKNGILLPKEFMALSTTYIFLENLYRELIYKLKLTKKPSVTINFNDLIEFHAITKKDEVDIRLHPGMEAKLNIKSDETTEIDFDDEDNE